MSRHPTMKWAQRLDKLYITIDLPDAKDVKLKLEPDGKFLFSATSGAENIPYELDIELFDKVDVNESKASIGLRNICYLVKKAEDKWWSRLLKQEGKPPVFLKVDWDKWVDEDDDPEETPGMDFGDIDFSKLNMGGDDDEEFNDIGGDDEEFNEIGGDQDEEIDDVSDTEEEHEEVKASEHEGVAPSEGK